MTARRCFYPLFRTLLMLVLVLSFTHQIVWAASISIGNVTVSESAGTVSFIIRIGVPEASTVTVGYATSDNTALAGEDYLATTGVAVINPGETRCLVEVPIIDDADVENVEQFLMNLSDPSAPDVIVDPQAWCNISMDDKAQLQIDDIIVDERDESAQFTVSMVGGPQPVNIPCGYTTNNGTATAVDDFTFVSGGAVILQGELSTTVNVPLVLDNIQEPDETFFMNISPGFNSIIVDGEGECTILASDIDTDGDGIWDSEESGHPDGGDGNGDGIADMLQANVVSLLSNSGATYITLELPPGQSLSNCRAVTHLSYGQAPDDIDFPFGLLDFTINTAVPAIATSLTLYLPTGTVVDTYYKYGKTPLNRIDHWYEFLYDGKTGADIDGNIITLHFIDGRRGDDDLDNTNGIIIDPGGPAAFRLSSGGGGGCFIHLTEQSGSHIIGMSIK